MSGCGSSHVDIPTPQELKELQRQLQGATDESTKKKVQQEISITQAKREVAEAKRVS